LSAGTAGTAPLTRRDLVAITFVGIAIAARRIESLLLK